MPKKTPFDEVCSIFKIHPESNETYERFACRATDVINKCSDAQWKELSTDVQNWANSVLEAREVNKAPNKEARETASHLEGLLPTLDGYVAPEVEDDDTGGKPADDAEPDSDDDAADDNSADDDSSDDDEDGTDGDDDGDDNAEDDANDDGESDGDESADEQSADDGASEAEPEEQAPVARRKASEGKKDDGKKGAKAAPSKGKDKNVAKAAVAKKAAAPAPSKKGGGGNARRNIGDKDTIKILAKKNPYREGSLGGKVFGKYKDGMTVAQLTSATKGLNLTRPVAAMLRFDVGKGHIKINPADAA